MAPVGLEEEQDAAERLQDLNQRQRNEENQPAGRGRRAASNRYGAKAGNFAQNNLGTGAAGGSAAGAGVSAALQGQSATNVAKAGGGGWAVYTAMAALLDMVTWIGFFSGLFYLDFHYIMSKLKKGQGFFVYLAGWQKVVLLFANVIAVLFPILLGAIIYIAVCGNTVGKVTSALVHYGTFGYVQNFCSTPTNTGGASGGGGAGGEFSTLQDLPQTMWKANNFGDGVSDYPRVKPQVFSLVQAVFTNAQAAGLNIRVTSALRKAPKWSFSCHFLGEAVDIAVDPASTSNVTKLAQIGRDVGFGYVLNEYSTPSEQANGPHVHMQLTANSCAGRESETPPPVEYHMPQ